MLDRFIRWIACRSEYGEYKIETPIELPQLKRVPMAIPPSSPFHVCSVDGNRLHATKKYHQVKTTKKQKFRTNNGRAHCVEPIIADLISSHTEPIVFWELAEGYTYIVDGGWYLLFMFI